MSQAYSNQAALDVANAKAAATIEAARIAAEQKAASAANTAAKTNENTYYKRAKDLRNYAGDDSAWKYLNGLASSGSIDSGTLRSLCYSLGIDYTKYTTPTTTTGNIVMGPYRTPYEEMVASLNRQGFKAPHLLK